MAYSEDKLPSGLEAITELADADVLVVGDADDSNRAKKITAANFETDQDARAATLTNKTIDGDDNTLQDIAMSSTKLVDGTGLTLTTDTLSVDASQTQITAVGTLATGNATAIVDAATDSAAGKVELATIAETDTGTDATRAITPDGLQGSLRNIRWLVFNPITPGTDCAADTNISGDFVSPIAGTILQSDTTPFYLYATNSTAGITGTMVVDINIDGTSIMTTNKLDFDTTEKTTTTAATPPDLTTTALAVGDIITIDIDSIHSGTAAKGLTVYMAIRET
jgi:hypothetical protein